MSTGVGVVTGVTVSAGRVGIAGERSGAPRIRVCGRATTLSGNAGAGHVPDKGRMGMATTRHQMLAITVAIGLVAMVSAPAARAAPGEPRDEADWMLAAQLPDGSIASHADRTFVNPYLGGFAAAGLAAATRATGNPAYADAAWRHSVQIAGDLVRLATGL